MSLLKPCTFTVCLAFTMLLTACSSHIPAEIKQPVLNAPSIQQVRHSSSEYISRKVRWGGTILKTENKQNASWLSIVAFPLNSDGRPMQSGESTGRFIAIIGEFLEPLVYTREREITISGTLLRTESRKIGEFSYDYPVVKVEHYYLWPPLATLDTDYPPYWWHSPWYDPWYDPWFYPSRPYHLRPKAIEK